MLPSGFFAFFTAPKSQPAAFGWPSPHLAPPPPPPTSNNAGPAAHVPVPRGVGEGTARRLALQKFTPLTKAAPADHPPGDRGCGQDRSQARGEEGGGSGRRLRRARVVRARLLPTRGGQPLRAAPAAGIGPLAVRQTAVGCSGGWRQRHFQISSAFFLVSPHNSSPGSLQVRPGPRQVPGPIH